MGKINQGILGGFSGKVGTVIGGRWKNINYMRAKASSVTNPRTEAQLIQRSKFATVLRFLQPLTEFLRTGFKLYSNGMTQFNSAMSYNLNNAVIGNYPNFLLDYTKVLVSRGHLTGALNPITENEGPRQISISWDVNTGVGNAKDSDFALIAIYNPSKGEAITETKETHRSEGRREMNLPQDYTGDTLQIFLGFISEDGKNVSNSSYVDSITVT